MKPTPEAALAAHRVLRALAIRELLADRVLAVHPAMVAQLLAEAAPSDADLEAARRFFQARHPRVRA